MKVPPWMRGIWQHIWPQPKPEPEFGLEIGINLGYSLAGDPAKADQIAALGVTWVRLPLAWDWIEPSKGAYDWTPMLGTVDAFNSRGISVLLITDPSNLVNPPYADPSQPPGPHAPVSPSEVAAYANFFGLAAQMLGNRSVMYEIGNEPLWNMTPAQYTTLAKAAAAQIRSNYSGKGRRCTIIGPGVTPDHADFIQKCVPEGLFDHLDGCSLHPYGYGQPNWRPLKQLTADYDAVRAMLAAYPNMPIYATECGYSTVGDTSVDAFTLDGQSTAILNLCKVNRTYGIPLTIVYEYSDDASKAQLPPPGNHEAGFGFVDQNFAPKPSYYAMQSFLRGRIPFWPKKKRPSEGLQV